jgi:hypothetical protein
MLVSMQMMTGAVDVVAVAVHVVAVERQVVRVERQVTAVEAHVMVVIDAMRAVDRERRVRVSDVTSPERRRRASSRRGHAPLWRMGDQQRRVCHRLLSSTG